VRNMRLAGIPEIAAMQITGHKTRSIFYRYSIVGGQEIQDAAAKLEDRLKKIWAQFWAQSAIQRSKRRETARTTRPASH